MKRITTMAMMAVLAFVFSGCGGSMFPDPYSQESGIAQDEGIIAVNGHRLHTTNSGLGATGNNDPIRFIHGDRGKKEKAYFSLVLRDQNGKRKLLRMYPEKDYFIAKLSAGNYKIESINYNDSSFWSPVWYENSVYPTIEVKSENVTFMSINMNSSSIGGIFGGFYGHWKVTIQTGGEMAKQKVAELKSSDVIPSNFEYIDTFGSIVYEYNTNYRLSTYKSDFNGRKSDVVVLFPDVRNVFYLMDGERLNTREYYGFSEAGFEKFKAALKSQNFLVDRKEYESWL